MAIKISGDTVIYDNKVFQVGSGTTAQRPATPATGMIWFNSELQTFEGYDGTAWAAVGGGVDEYVLDGKQDTLISGTSIRTINETSILSAGDITIPGAVFSAVEVVPEGVAYAWGSNTNGKLGDGTTTNRSSPVSVVGGFTDWTQLSAGYRHMAAVRSNGSAWAWGYNSNGQLGDGTTVDKSSPVSVAGGFTDWTQLSAGVNHTAAVRANGTAWAWGSSNAGQLGDGTTVDKSSPVSVAGGFTDWTQISASTADFGVFTAAVRANGTAWAWGDGYYGQLGDGTGGGGTGKSSPVSVVGGFTDWTQISVGNYHTAAVRANGSAWAWGDNYYGYLGDGTSGDSQSSPVSVIGGFTDWAQISAGRNFTIALRSNGTTWGWGGGNNSGQMGDGTTTNRSSPVSVVGGFTDWVQIDAGGGHATAIRSNGTAWAWGSSNAGQLGDGSSFYKTSPVSVVGGFTDWFQISAGYNHTTAIKTV